MPNIRQYESNERPLTPSNMAESAFAQLGAHAERQAEIIPHLWEQGANQVVQGLDQLYEQQARNQTASAANDMADLTVQMHQGMSATLNSADPTSAENPLD